MMQAIRAGGIAIGGYAIAAIMYTSAKNAAVIAHALHVLPPLVRGVVSVVDTAAALPLLSISGGILSSTILPRVRGSRSYRALSVFQAISSARYLFSCVSFGGFAYPGKLTSGAIAMASFVCGYARALASSPAFL